MNNITTLPFSILEEIGFEGLEGITIEGLWKRLSVRLKLPLPLNDKFRNEVWSFIQSAKCLQFYTLPEEREPLKLFDRTESTDPFFGDFVPDTCPYSVYKYNPISTQDVRGSCEHFDTRQPIEKDNVLDSTVDAIENKYGRSLVIVGSQSLRTSLLLPPTVSRDIDLTISNYCILERLARARYNGELAQGKYSLADIGGDPVAFHNQKKKLSHYNLIKCQSFVNRTDTTNTSGQLIHLSRFYAQFKPRHMVTMEKIINYLKTKPNCMAQYQDVKDQFEEQYQRYLKRFFKSPFFHKFVITDTKVPYRAIFPDATVSEWRLPKKNTERSLNVLQLRDPNVEADQFWDTFVNATNDLGDDDESEGFLDDSHAVRDTPIAYQLFKHIESTKELGVSEAEATSFLGQSKLNGRSVVRSFMKASIVDYYTTNQGRQTLRRYITPKFSKNHKKTINEIITDAGIGSSSERTATAGVEANESMHVDDQNETEVDSTVEIREYDEFGQECPINYFDETLRTEQEIHKSQISGDIIVKVTEINETQHRLPKKQLNEQQLTDRSKERLKFIQHEVQSKKIFDDPSKILSELKTDELSRGLTDIMCRKTFFRLLTYLCKMELIRLWRIEFQYKSKHRSLLYVTSKDIDSSYTLMQSCIDQAKSKFQLNIYEEESRNEGRMARSLSQKTDVEKQGPAIKAKKGQKLTTSTNESFNYGYTPKFIRLRTLHEFMFYLARLHHQSTEALNQEEVVTKLVQNSPDAFDDDFSEMPTIWDDELGWKMFVPPLVKHNSFDDGWCLLSDCIYRMPLSIFVKVINIAYEIKGLNEYISHPIKKHFLVKDIPVNLQQMLFSRRKYIASLHELLRRLICIGLVQAGPHRAQKDHAFYYMNVFARLVDTSGSEPGTYYVSEQEYPEILYKFNSLDDVYSYWDNMHRICMSTKLNRKPTNADVTPADRMVPLKFEPFMSAIQPRQAIERDRGDLPGDRRGAAGLDSYFFAHLERNWAFNPAKFKPKLRAKIRKTDTQKERPNRLVRVTRDVNMRKRGEGRLTTVPLHKLKTAAIRRRGPIVRKKTIVVKNKKKRASAKYDDIDKMALQYMSKLRVDWNPQEDNFLLLCKVAQMYLLPNNRLMVPGQLIRDLIHWHCKSLNKTSTACRRRINYILKKLPNSEQINNSILTCLNEIKSNKSIAKRFGDNFMQNLKKVYPIEKQFERAFKIHFIDLVHTLSCQFYNLTNSFESNTLILPKTLQEFYANFAERNDTAVYDFNTIRYDEPKSVDDIKIASILSLIHSTVCCTQDKTSWSIQLYEIYKDFPENLLSLAMIKVRSDQMISQNKISTNSLHNKIQNRCLPLSSSGFHLSATYQQQMTTKISYSLFDDSYLSLKNIFEDVNGQNQAHVLNLSNSIMCFFIPELLYRNSYDINIEMPKRVLLLDPAKRLPDESFDSIYARFHEIFNYIPKIGLDDSPFDEMISKIPANDAENAAVANDTTNIMEKLENLPPETLHFFCIINQFGATRPRNQIELMENGCCPFDCIRNLQNPMEHIKENLLTKREVWYRLNIEQFEFEPLPAVVTIDEINLIAVYNFLVLKGVNATEEQRTINLDHFKQVSDIVDELLLENDKDFIDEDFGAEYDLRSDVKKKLYDGAQINDKIHKFHDFLCVNTCKLSLVLKTDEDPTDVINLQDLNKKRDGVLAKIVQNANWSPELRSSKNVIEFLTDVGLNMDEIHIAIDIHNYIEGQGEMGVTGTELLERYEGKPFLQMILDQFNEAKFVMKTGVCEVTYVHSKHIKPWTVNTYHLKRLDREAIVPTTKSIFQVSHEPSTSSAKKRKEDSGNDCNDDAKRRRTDESSKSDENEAMTTEENVVDSAAPKQNDETEKVQNEASKSTASSKRAKRLAEKTIEHGTKIEQTLIPQTKKTFPLKIAPWIRVNGSVNRRVLDKYAGTILLYCIENVGLTLFSLCTRFHYLLPIHVHEIVKYLEEFGCLTRTAITNRKPVSLFSTYESVSLEPATDLDDFKSIVIEPTIDAISKMTIFIGERKYKEDFI